MAAADNTPDFDSMSPEEINRWLESLAKRQGANSDELTTSADMDIAEVDPNTVVIDEPGYVPYGEERPERPPRQMPVAVEPPAAPPKLEPEPEPTWRAPERPAVEEPAAALDDDAMAWLESLASDQGDALFNLDLNALTDEIEHRAPARADEPTDPMAWLKSLADEDDAPTLQPSVEAEPEREPASEPTFSSPNVADPFESGVDPMAWLENLARRQGARSDELTTSTEMNIPVPENPVIDEPGYKPFSFDDAVETRRPTLPEPEPLDLENPASWLESLADDQGFDESQIIAPEPEPEPEPETLSEPASADVSFEIADIEAAIAAGTVTPEQMQVYLEHETDVYVDSMDEDAPDGEGLPVPAELPDWLLEQVGPPPVGDESEPLDHPPALTEAITEPPPAADLPEWLQEDLPAEGELDFDSIFANEDDEAFVAPDSGDYGGLTLDVDPSDPWVEAFDAEQDGEVASLESPPDWYVRNLNDPERVAAVEGYAPLAEAALPEEAELPHGELMPLPDWFAAPVDEAEVEEEAAAVDLPDWLSELDAESMPDSIPEWLTESMDEPAQAAAPPEPEPTPEPVYTPPAPVMRSTSPAPEILEEARARARDGELAVALDTYDTLVRSQRELDSVVADLQSLVRQHRSNPTVFRVLGDGLMRQGKLQSALDTYREALNLL